jgi:hypothetical protein
MINKDVDLSLNSIDDELGERLGALNEIKSLEDEGVLLDDLGGLECLLHVFSKVLEELLCFGIRSERIGRSWNRSADTEKKIRKKRTV